MRHFFRSLVSTPALATSLANAYIPPIREKGKQGMDSLTQAVLGATVGYAIGGRQLGRKAALWGIGLGTLPDLDVLVRYADPIDSFVMHRSWTHSLLVTSLAAIPIGLMISRLHRQASTVAFRMIAMTWLIFFTHIMLDSMTTYGTQIFWGLSDLISALPQEPIGIGSISIIDPIYTIPLLIATVWILIRGRQKPDGTLSMAGKATLTSLAFSTLYLGWGLGVQSYVEQQTREDMAARGVKIDRLFTTPSLGNSVLWYVLVREGDKIHYGLRSILDDPATPITITTIERKSENLAILPDRDGANKVMAFSKGFYRFQNINDRVSIADVRMGFPPNFVFNFAIADRPSKDKALMALKPAMHERGQIDQRIFAFLWDRMFNAQAATPD